MKPDSTFMLAGLRDSRIYQRKFGSKPATLEILWENPFVNHLLYLKRILLFYPKCLYHGS